MDEILLKLNKRTASGKKVVDLRGENVIPSVVYGDGKSTLTESDKVPTVKMVQAAGKHTPVTLDMDGKKKLAIIKTIDIDPTRHQLRHVAFHLIKKGEAIVTQVPITLVGQGESVAEKAGLIVLQAIDTLEIKAKPADLPEALELSIIDLATIEDKLTIGDIVLPKGVEFADADLNKELVVANVYEPSALQAANESVGGEAEEETIAEETEAEAEAEGEGGKKDESKAE